MPDPTKPLTARIVLGLRAALPRRTVLPVEDYHGASRRSRRVVDDAIIERLPYLPTVPGVWYDGEGDPWLLAADGSWTDADGVRRSAVHAPALALFGPWTATPDANTDADETEGGARQ